MSFDDIQPQTFCFLHQNEARFLLLHVEEASSFLSIPLAKNKEDALNQPDQCGIYFVPACCVAAGKKFRKFWRSTGGGLTYIAKNSDASVCQSTRIFTKNRTSNSKCIEPGTLLMRCYVLHADVCGCNRCFRSRASLPAILQPIRSDNMEILHAAANTFALVQIISTPHAIQGSLDSWLHSSNAQPLVQASPPSSPFHSPLVTHRSQDNVGPLVADGGRGADEEYAAAPERMAYADGAGPPRNPLMSPTYPSTLPSRTKNRLASEAMTPNPASPGARDSAPRVDSDIWWAEVSERLFFDAPESGPDDFRDESADACSGRSEMPNRPGES